MSSLPPLPFPASAISSQLSELEKVLEILVKSPNSVEAGKYILQRRTSLEHLILLLEMVKSRTKSGHAVMFCAIEIKNVVKENWQLYRDNADAGLLDYVRKTLLLFYLHPPFEAKQPIAFFKDAVVAICAAEEGGWWPGLAQTMVAQMGDSDHERNLRCLKLLSKLTKKFEEQSRSDPLYAEIIGTIDTFHDKLLMFVQGYINTLSQGVVDQSLVLEIIRVSLKVFYRFVYQDIHPKIEDSIRAWAGVIKQVLVPEFGAGAHDPALVFKARGEATKICMFVSTKYREDFQEHVRSFVETIWSNCLRLAGGGDVETLVSSIGFFKAFASSEDYLSFFENNISDIVAKLLLPGLVPDEEDQRLFLEEPDAFAEQMFSWPHPSFRRRHAVADLAATLAKFHPQGIISALRAALAALESNRSLATIPQQLALVDLAALSVVSAQTAAQGASQLIAPLSFPQEIWTKLCENFWVEFVHNQSALPESQRMAALFAVCHHCRFAGVFRYALDIPRLLAQTAGLFESARGCAAARAVLHEFSARLLEARKFSVIDKLNAPDTALSFFQKYYNNPRKLIFELQREVSLFNFEEHAQPLGQILEALLCEAAHGAFDRHSAALLLELARRAEGAQSFAARMLPLIEQFFTRLAEGPAVQHSDILTPMFDAVGRLASRPENAALVVDPLRRLAASADRLQPETLALLFQAVVILAQKMPSALEAEEFKALASVSMRSEIYTPDNLNPAGFAARLAAELICASKNEAHWPAFTQVCERLLELKLVRPFFEVQELMVLNEHFATKSFVMVLAAARTFCSPSSAYSPDQALTATLFFRLFLSYLCLFVDKGGFAKLVEFCQKSGNFDSLRIVLHSQAFANVISTQGVPRTFQFLVLGKILLEEFKIFESTNMQQEFSTMIGALIENMWNRRFNSKALAGRIDEIKERDTLNKLSNNALVSSHRLQNLEPPSKNYIDQFIAKTGIQNSMVDSFLIEKIANFAFSIGINLDQLVSNKKHLDIFPKK